MQKTCDDIGSCDPLSCRPCYDRARRMQVYAYADAIKVERGCIDCGYSANPIALDFDHVRGVKLRNVSACKTIAQADEEIAKCEVRCANCHRIKTKERRSEA